MMMKICNNLITKIAAFVLICGVALLTGAPPVAAANVNIPDANLRKVINYALGGINRAATAAVTEAEMKTLTSLTAGGASISNLTGLEKATNLTWLQVTDGSFTDISAVRGLTKLTGLTLVGSFSDISALRELTKLTELDLVGAFSDISAVRGLTKLTTLILVGMGSSISDISPLVSNTGLGTGDSVSLGRNPLSYPSIYTYIPALQTRGVEVNFTNRVPTTLTKVSGDTQTGAISAALANPFVVEVKDGATTPKTFAGVPVTFAVTGGGGTLSATSVATDATGRAQVTLTPGTTAATQTVTATVTHAGETLTQTFTATANRMPTFTSAATFAVAENTTAVGTVVATDADSQDSVTGYTLSGTDSAKFAITNAGVLTFVASPDYDAPGDLVSTEPANAAANNEYIIVVTATSGSGARELTTPQTLTITVTDVNEPPAKPSAPTVTAASATPTSLNVSWTAPTNTGPAITAYNLQYRKNNEVSWTAATYAGTDTNTTLTGLTVGTTYDVQVMAKNGEGDGPWSNSGSATTATNAVPGFTSADTFSLAENTTAVGTVVAADADSADTSPGMKSPPAWIVPSSLSPTPAC